MSRRYPVTTLRVIATALARTLLVIVVIVLTIVVWVYSP